MAEIVERAKDIARRLLRHENAVLYRYSTDNDSCAGYYY